MMKKSELTGWKKETAEKLTAAYPGDERTARANEKGLAACGAVAFLYIVARLIYVGFHGELALPELVLLFIMFLVLGLVNRQNSVYELPRVLGKQLDPAPAAKGKRFMFYALNALLYSGSFAVADLIVDINHLKPMAFQIATDFAIGFATWFIVDVLYYEHKVKRYNGYMAKLEAEENDLS